MRRDQPVIIKDEPIPAVLEPAISSNNPDLVTPEIWGGLSEEDRRFTFREVTLRGYINFSERFLDLIPDEAGRQEMLHGGNDHLFVRSVVRGALPALKFLVEKTPDLAQRKRMFDRLFPGLWASVSRDFLTAMLPDGSLSEDVVVTQDIAGIRRLRESLIIAFGGAGTESAADMVIMKFIKHEHDEKALFLKFPELPSIEQQSIALKLVGDFYSSRPAADVATGGAPAAVLSGGAGTGHSNRR